MELAGVDHSVAASVLTWRVVPRQRRARGTSVLEVDQDLLPEEAHVRVTAAFSRLLGFSGTVVEKVVFTATQILVTVRLRSRRLRCPCGRTSSATYDRLWRSWRHLDLGRFKVVVQAQVRRVDCRGCGRVRTEQVPWARPGARHTRDFDDIAAWLVRRMSKAAVATLLRTSWNTVDGLVRRVVTAHLDPHVASRRPAPLVRIGVDEIAYREGRKFHRMTIVTDHDSGHVVWVREGRSQTALIAFLDTLGPVREQVQAISMDMTRIYREAARIHLPQAAICYDPFHLIKWAGEACSAAARSTITHPPSLRRHNRDRPSTWIGTLGLYRRQQPAVDCPLRTDGLRPGRVASRRDARSGD